MLRYFRDGGKRAALAWHRRAGKDEVGLHLTAHMAHRRVGAYWHLLPKQTQARKAIWDAVNPHTGLKRIDEAFPKALRKSTRNTDMFIEFLNGSTWQVLGSDSYDTHVGAPPVGIIFSEWALGDPAAWAYLRPILRENGGWALFISTFRAKNHHHKLVKRAIREPEWFGEILSAEETGILSPEELDAERREYIDEYGEDEGDALFSQEYLSVPMTIVRGAFFGPQMIRLEEQKRITRVPYVRAEPVTTAWDLGMDDETAIWFVQRIGFETRVIDFLHARNQDLAWYAQQLRAKGYTYAEHWLPHDGAHKTINGPSPRKQLRGFKLGPVRIAERPLNDAHKIAQINEARSLLSECYFDEERCEYGLEALRNYSREWDDDAKTYSSRPKHDWASHPADAWRTLAIGLKKSKASSPDNDMSMDDLAKKYGYG